MTADIFVGIASYRDHNVTRTVRQAIDRAGARVNVGVCLQDDRTEIIDQLLSYGVEVIQVAPGYARGCGWARALAVTCWSGEPWYFQTDAHMLFEDGWALHLIEQSEMLPTPGIMTYYPPQSNHVDENRTIIADVARFEYPWGIAHKSLSVPVVEKPIIGRVLSGACQFMPAEVLERCPLDPYYFFWGEEPAMAARFWTHGYDIWHPGGRPKVRHIHHLNRPGVSRIFDEQQRKSQALNKRAGDRIKVLYGWAEGDLGAYGLGKTRSFAEYEMAHGLSYSKRAFMTDHVWRRRNTYGMRIL